MFINYFKAAIYISFKSYEEAMKAEKKRGIFFRNQSLSKKNEVDTLKDYIDKAMSILSPSEARILKLRFGLEDGRARELEEVNSVNYSNFDYYRFNTLTNFNRTFTKTMTQSVSNAYNASSIANSNYSSGSGSSGGFSGGFSGGGSFGGGGGGGRF